MQKPIIEEMPDGSTYATIPALWDRGDGILEPGEYAATGDRIVTAWLSGPPTVAGWGTHDGPAYYVTADGCAWSCRVNRATWSLLP